MNKDKNIYYVEEKIPAEFIFTGETTFWEYSCKWLEAREKDLAPKTFCRYCSLLERVNMGIGHIPLEKLDPYHLTEFYKRLSQDGANFKTGKGLSDKTILHHHSLVSVILREATRERIIPYNIADRDYMKRPKVTDKNIRFLDEDEAKRLVRLLNREDPKWRTATLLLLTTGLRRGELMGLEWSDINFRKGLISVNRASQYTAKHGIITTTTKTKESKRIFSISEHEINILGKYREWWLIEKSRNSWGRAERLFLQENGLPMHPDSVTDWLKKFCLKHSFKHFSPHALRHTNVSLLIAAGISIREVAARVGHARASTTSDLYAHSVKSAEVKASRVIPALLFEVGIC